MSIENLIYNCRVVGYLERLYQNDYQRLCLYEGRYGKYMGEIIDIRYIILTQVNTWEKYTKKDW